jgi:hypothetical protein
VFREQPIRFGFVKIGLRLPQIGRVELRERRVLGHQLPRRNRHGAHAARDRRVDAHGGFIPPHQAGVHPMNLRRLQLDRNDRERRLLRRVGRKNDVLSGDFWPRRDFRLRRFGTGREQGKKQGDPRGKNEAE